MSGKIFFYTMQLAMTAACPSMPGGGRGGSSLIVDVVDDHFFQGRRRERDSGTRSPSSPPCIVQSRVAIAGWFHRILGGSLPAISPAGPR